MPGSGDVFHVSQIIALLFWEFSGMLTPPTLQLNKTQPAPMTGSSLPHCPLSPSLAHSFCPRDPGLPADLQARPHSLPRGLCTDHSLCSGMGLGSSIHLGSNVNFPERCSLTPSLEQPSPHSHDAPSPCPVLLASEHFLPTTYKPVNHASPSTSTLCLAS